MGTGRVVTGEVLTTQSANVKSHKSCITKGVLQLTAAVLRSLEERGGRGLSGSLNEWAGSDVEFRRVRREGLSG